ncbi:hypothetical protein JXB28_00405 [Candidatus Woesearchaeota archaeon]|nr:hypothetical protein [Candidatus Woesearchaeota archaeon]
MEIDKESKMIHFVNYMGKTYDYRYDLLLTAKLTDPNNKFEKKHGFFSIEVKYLVFDENDINIKTAQFNYLENAAELVSLISQGELSIGQIKDNLLPQA